MIKNEEQYEYSRYWARRFEQSIAACEQDEARKKNDPQGWELNRNTLLYHLDTLKQEIVEYETLTAHDYRSPILLELDDLDYLPQILIKARIAANLSQKELADLAGLTEQQIKDYETHDYQTASFLDFLFVVNALDLKVKNCQFLAPLDSLRRTPITLETEEHPISASSHFKPQ